MVSLMIQSCQCLFSSVLHSGDLNIDNVNTKLLNFLKFRFQIVWYSNGGSMDYVLCNGLTIWILDHYIRKQDGFHLSGIQMAFENQTIWHSTSFQPFEYQIRSVFRSLNLFRSQVNCFYWFRYHGFKSIIAFVPQHRFKTGQVNHLFHHLVKGHP